MTWLKLGEEFTKEAARAGLSDAAFRTHVEGLAYAVDRETDGILDRRDVRRFAETEDPGAAVAELLAADLWIRTGPDELRIVHHMQEQPSAAYLTNKRANDARRQRRARERQALKAQGLTDDAIGAELAARGLGKDTPPAVPEASRGESRRDTGAESRRDNTRDPERNGTDRTGPVRDGTSFDDKQPKNQAEPWLATVPAGLQCSVNDCDRRVTEYSAQFGQYCAGHGEELGGRDA
ncbi:hypothetical protein [Glutamicibacter sp. 2E12]|uniref:hypothetical protein n=1 Tax=Glutamicibacter sp. 2E12 TaxID=3416181 RepID=UPI003CF0B35E